MSRDLREIIRRNSWPLEPQPTGHPTSLGPIEGIRAVLFDIYGTLFISASGDIAADNADPHSQQTDRAQLIIHETFAAAGLPARSAELFRHDAPRNSIAKVHEEMRGQGVEYPEVDILDVWRAALETLPAEGQPRCEELSDETLRRLATEYEVRANPVWPMPGARECLHRLRDAGLMLGVVSNAQCYTPELFPALLNEEMDSLGFHRRLRFYSYEHRRAKPGIDLYRMASKQLKTHGITAEETLFVGNDMLNDVAAARQAGFRTALFAGDARSLRLRKRDKRLRGAAPDLVIDRLTQLPESIMRAT